MRKLLTMVVALVLMLAILPVAQADGDGSLVVEGYAEFIESKENGRLISFGDESETGKGYVKNSGWDGEYPTGILSNGKFLREKGGAKADEVVTNKHKVKVTLFREYIMEVKDVINQPALSAGIIVDYTKITMKGLIGHRKNLSDKSKVVGEIEFANGSKLNLTLSNNALGFNAGVNPGATTNGDNSGMTVPNQTHTDSPRNPGDSEDYPVNPGDPSISPVNLGNPDVSPVNPGGSDVSPVNPTASSDSTTIDPTQYDSYSVYDRNHSENGYVEDVTASGKETLSWASNDSLHEVSWTQGDHTHTESVSQENSEGHYTYQKNK